SAPRPMRFDSPCGSVIVDSTIHKGAKTQFRLVVRTHRATALGASILPLQDVQRPYIATGEGTMPTLTVYFDDSWWVGVIELDEDRILRVFRHVFGSEPSNAEVLDFVLNRLTALIAQPIAGVAIAPPTPQKINPKRAAREAAQRMQTRGISTKAQEAL